jgi:rubredoxin
MDEFFQDSLEPFNTKDCREEFKGPIKDYKLWKCPTCGNPPGDLVALDGGSRPCSNEKCYTHFHLCGFTGKEAEGPPLHEVEFEDDFEELVSR